MADSVVAPNGTVQLSQLPGTVFQQPIDLSSLAVPAWQASTAVAANALVRPTTPNQNGFWFRANAAGQTGALEPAWSGTGTVTDGSLTWTPVIPPASGSDSISSIAVTQESPPDGELNVTAATSGALTGIVTVSGGTAANTYTILVAVTMASTRVWEFLIVMSILEP